jgi:hypothetical protein
MKGSFSSQVQFLDVPANSGQGLMYEEIRAGVLVDTTPGASTFGRIYRETPDRRLTDITERAGPELIQERDRLMQAKALEAAKPKYRTSGDSPESELSKLGRNVKRLSQEIKNLTGKEN